MNTLSDLDLYLQKIQTHILCLGCRRNCEKKWFSPIVIAENAKKSDKMNDKATALKHCLFCRHFHPDKDTVETVMKEAEWFFIKSGEDRFKSFYCEYAREASLWFRGTHASPCAPCAPCLNVVLAGSKQNQSPYELHKEIGGKIDTKIDTEVDWMDM